MKTIYEFLLNKKTEKHKTEITYRPTKHDDLKQIIEKLINDGETNFNCIDTSNITNMEYLFPYDVDDIDVSEWDVSKVKDMTGLFAYCKNFNADLSKWDVSNVEDMRYMFVNCAAFDSDISKWDVSHVKFMYNMFSGCSSFSADLSGWDVRCVSSMYNMFAGCKSFTADLSAWDMAPATVYQRNGYMFQGCKHMFDNCPAPLPQWYKEYVKKNNI